MTAARFASEPVRRSAPSVDPARRLSGAPMAEGKVTPASASHSATGVPLFLQAKLAISQPGDAYEQEADRVADRIMRMPEPALQRSCAACSSGGAPCPACAPDKDELVMRKSEVGAAASAATPSVATPIAAAGSGRPLDTGARAFFEPRFGRGFSDVRIHDDARAAESARALGARAYALGRDLAFAPGQYAPHTESGRRLLAHELTHVVQQRGAPAPQIRRAPDDAAAAGSAAASDRCKGRNLDELEFDSFIHAISARHGSEADIDMLYLSLKRTRSCFPSYSEADFLADVSEGTLYSDETRKTVAAGAPHDVAADDRRLAWRESQKPFAGYSVSGFDASARFTTSQRVGQLGYTPTASHTAPSEMMMDPSQAQKSFAAADVLAFSGHQYAQYKAPGVWSDDSGKVAYDARTLRGPLDNVKLIVSTSCATICREPTEIWRRLFPKATFLGYKKSAPLNGAVMAGKFASALPKDLILDASGVASAASAWKSAIQANHRDDAYTQAGVLDVAANQVEYWDGKAFHTIAAGSDENKCKEKGDYSASTPDPGTWRT